MTPTPDRNTDGLQDAAILNPDRHATIAGVALVMREYTFAETLQHQALIGALCEAMTGVAMRGDFHDLDSLRAAFGDNGQILLRLIAIACDQPLAWVQALTGIEGEDLFMLWWGVNSDFFLRRVLLSVQLRKARELDGLTFSLRSALPDSAMPSDLPDTPTVN